MSTVKAWPNVVCFAVFSCNHSFTVKHPNFSYQSNLSAGLRSYMLGQTSVLSSVAKSTWLNSAKATLWLKPCLANGPASEQARSTRMNQYQNVKQVWIYLQKQMMEMVVVTTRSLRHYDMQSQIQHIDQHTFTQVFYRSDAIPSAGSTASVKAMKAELRFISCMHVCIHVILTAIFQVNLG